MTTTDIAHDRYLDALTAIQRIARHSLNREVLKIIEIIDDTLAQVDQIEAEERRRLDAEYYAERESAA